MPALMEHILVFALVAGCAAFVLWQLILPFLGRRSRLGSCCSRGCAAATAKPAERVVFIPVEMLTRKRSR